VDAPPRGRPAPFRARANALLRLIDAYDFETGIATEWLRGRPAGHAGYRTVQLLPGIGPTLAAVFVAEIGEIGRFTDAPRLCSWAGLTPRHRESDTTVHRGRITQQGSKLVRRAAVEAAQKSPAGSWLTSTRAGIAERRGRNIATVAVAHGQFTFAAPGAGPSVAGSVRQRSASRGRYLLRPPLLLTAASFASSEPACSRTRTGDSRAACSDATRVLRNAHGAERVSPLFGPWASSPHPWAIDAGSIG
jgi:hypothetical protein